jgi:hypothetical protein
MVMNNEQETEIRLDNDKDQQDPELIINHYKNRRCSTHQYAINCLLYNSYFPIVSHGPVQLEMRSVICISVNSQK